MASGKSAVKAVYTSDLVTSFDIIKPEVWASLVKSKGNQADYFNVIASLGFKIPTSNVTYEHFEDDWVHESVAAKAPIVIGAAGAVTTFTVADANVDTNGNFYVRAKDVLLLQNGTRATVTDITGLVVTIAPFAAADTATVTAADEMAIITNMFGEGTDQPLGRFSGTRKYTNNTQIIKEKIKVTGSQMTDGLYFNPIPTYAGEGGKAVSGSYMIKGQQDAEVRMAILMEGACLMGRKNTNTTVNKDADTGKAAKSTEGTIPYIEDNGTTVNYTPGSFTVSKFTQINKVADKENAPDNYAGFVGIDLHDTFDDAFIDFNKDFNTSFTSEVTGGKKSIDIGFQFLKRSGRKFGFSRLKTLSNQKTYGAVGMKYSSWGVFIPLGMNKSMDANGASSKLPTVGMRHKSLGGYDRFMEVWTVAGAGNGQKVTENDSHNLSLRSEIGSHNMVGNQMIIMKP